MSVIKLGKISGKILLRDAQGQGSAVPAGISASDSMERPVPNIRVCIKGNEKFTISDSDGDFEFTNISRGEYTISLDSSSLPAYSQVISDPEIALKLMPGKKIRDINFIVLISPRPSRRTLSIQQQMQPEKPDQESQPGMLTTAPEEKSRLSPSTSTAAPGMRTHARTLNSEAEPEPQVNTNPVTYSVQVVALRQKSHVKRIAQTLSKKGFSCTIAQRVKPRQLFILKVGKYPSYAEAVAARLRLNKQGFSSRITTN
jgi:cell division septation protein DedD